MHGSNHSSRLSRSGLAGLVLLVSGLIVAGCVTPSGGGGGGTTSTSTTSTTSTTTTSTTTTTLPLHDVTVPCPAGQDCSGTANGTTSNLVVQSTGGAGGEVTIDVNDSGPLDCSGIVPPPFYVPVNPDIYTLDSTTNTAKTITITTIGGKAVLAAVPGAGAYSLGVCFASPHPFTSLKSTPPFFGAAQLVGGEYIGLLPNCVSVPHLTFGPPCVSARGITGNDTFITAKLPAGDPRTR